LAGYQIVLHYLVDRSLTTRLGERARADGVKRAALGVHGEAQDVMQAVVRLREGQYLAVQACAHNAPLWNAAHEKGLRFRIVCYAFGNESLIRNLKGHFGVGDLGQFRFHRGAQSLEILIVPEPLITQERRGQKALAELERLSQAGERIVAGARSRLIGAKIKIERRVVRSLPQEPLDRGDGALIGIFRALPRGDPKSKGEGNGGSERGAQPASHSVIRHQRHNTSHNLPPQFVKLPRRNDSRAGKFEEIVAETQSSGLQQVVKKRLSRRLWRPERFEPPVRGCACGCSRNRSQIQSIAIRPGESRCRAAGSPSATAKAICPSAE